MMTMMMMENAEVKSSGTAEEFVGSSSGHCPKIIAKRKRTKRRRLSISGVYGSVSSSANAEEKDRNYENSVTTTIDEETDDYIANCLILLAQNGGRTSRTSCSHGDEVIFDESSSSLKLNKIDTISSFSSLIPSGVDSNALYECKTCDKSFRTFQALGGHRASHHKKPNNLFLDDHATVTTKFKPNDKTSELLAVNKQPSPSPSSILSYDTIIHSSSKVHECSICGSVFSSGQALGGHMRRHRTTTTAIHDNRLVVAADAELARTEKVAVLMSADGYIRSDKNTNYKFLSSLDLNLPAPADEELTIIVL